MRGWRAITRIDETGSIARPMTAARPVRSVDAMKKTLLITLLFTALIVLALGGWAVDATRKLRFSRPSPRLRPA
jgi:hypothetical protein